jgi:hypothetical protein
MKFAYPEFLFALFAIAIPIIIHLFNFRKFKKIYFSNVEFLKDVQQETQSKSKLKHLLILLSRILAISFLVLAFAQPFIPTSDTNSSNQNNVVGLYIDNSFSMEGTNDNGSLLNDAKIKAIEIVGAYRNTDKFILSCNDFNPGDQRILSNEEVVDKIEAISVSSSTRMLSAIYSRVRDAINSSDIKNKSFYVLSDFQKSTADLKNIKADTLIETYLAPIKSSTINNLYVDTCWFNSPTHLINQQEELSIRVKNNANNDLENIPLKLYINGQNVVPASFSIKANSEEVITLNYRNKSNGVQHGKIELRDNPIVMDDAFYFSYNISENIDVLCIQADESSTAMRAIYSTDSVFNYQGFNVNQLDYSLIKKNNLVVVQELKNISSGLSSTLKTFVDNGGSLLIIPPTEEINLESYQEFLSLLTVNYFTAQDTSKTKVREINLNHPIYKNVFESKPEGNINLPIVSNHYNVSKSTTSYRNDLMILKNGSPFLTEYKTGKGAVYLLASSLNKESNNFTNHALFVPTLYNIALASQKNHALFHIIGSNSTLELIRDEKDKVYHIKNENIDLIPQVRNNSNYTTVFVNSSIAEAGSYWLENNQSKIGLAYNYNRTESDLTCLNSSELEEVIMNNTINAKLLDLESGMVKTTLSELNIGKKYWKYCIILVLLFLAAEIALIKLFK